MIAQGGPPKPAPSGSAPSAPTFGGVTTANFDKKVDELKGLAAKIKELANPKDPKRDTLNGLLIARLFVGGTPVEFAPKFGASETMVIRFAGFATADPNDPLAKLILQALDCKRADPSCVEAQPRQLDGRRNEIEKIKLEAQTLSSNLLQCADAGLCTAHEGAEETDYGRVLRVRRHRTAGALDPGRRRTEGWRPIGRGQRVRAELRFPLVQQLPQSA